MNDVDALAVLSRPVLRQVLRAALIYGFIVLALLPLAALLLAVSSLAPALVAPAVICLTLLLDSYGWPRFMGSYIRPLVGITLYVLVILVLVPVASWVLLGNVPFAMFNVIWWLSPVVFGSLILGTTFPTALFRKADGARSALFWLSIVAPILGIISLVGLGAIRHYAIGIGNAF